MIFAMFRLALVGFIVMTVFYVLLSIYSRSLRRERLEEEWAEEGEIGDRDDYVEKGMKEYEGSLRPKLILGVYIVPTVVVMVVFFLVNYD